jgi:hypothetical protein
MAISFWLSIFLGSCFLLVVVGLAVKSEVKYNREIRKIRHERIYEECLDRINVMNGGKSMAFPGILKEVWQ